ncbi:hypothetical protein HPB49_002791 [Dermacentor silvarum]|uniref:Uncharacterized protein n=1 Tax=Dermacentor silvarum TaxID=543639 RepID=A0ACB8CNX8_DERSI|nr:hypothetical protein HPB49_002791 [Dermacentor silvarum]
MSDGAGNNKSMWQQFGVRGSISNTRHKIQPPCLPEGHHLHFICDVPHAIKFIRNHLLKHEYGQRFFGIVRCFKWDEDHPSITQFSQIYRLLSLYTPLKTAIKGNCTGLCDSVLVSFQDNLGFKAKAAAELKTTIESKLHKKLQCIISFPGENDTQD